MADVPSGNTVGGQGGVPKQIDDLKTGPALAPEARKEARRAKTPSERIERVEDRTDEQDDKLDAFGARLTNAEVTIAGFAGQMKIVPDLVETMKDATKAMRDRDTVVFTAKVDVAKAKELGNVHAEQTQREDAADAKKNRRERITKAVGLMTSGGVLIEILHHLGVL